MKRSKGFSLAEMMAVIAVLGILAVLLLPNVLNAYKDAKKGVLLDEAKAVYAEARNKYATMKASGKVVGVLTDAESDDDKTYSLELSNDKVEYFVRLDANGEVLSLVVIDGDYCIFGTGDFLDTATKDQVQSLYDENGNIRKECAKSNNEGLYAKVILYEGEEPNARPLPEGLVPSYSSEANENPEYSELYYYYGQGWYYAVKNAVDGTSEKLTLTKLSKAPGGDKEVFLGFNDKNGKEVIDKGGVLSVSQDVLGRFKSNDYCKTGSWENNDCVIALYAKYRDIEGELVYAPCQGTGTMESDSITSDVNTTVKDATYTSKGYGFAGWSLDGCDATTKIDQEHFSVSLNKNEDGKSITLYALWNPEIIDASDYLCEPDSDNYCKKPVYYDYEGKLFVLYRITNEGYKAITYGVEGPKSYLQTDCCNHGNCYYTSVNYTRGALAKHLNSTWLTSLDKNNYSRRIVNSSWYSGYKNHELLNIETARVGVLNYAEYLHTNGKGYMYVYEGATLTDAQKRANNTSDNKAWWWTMTPTTNQPYYYDGQYYLANVILRYDPSRGIVDYDEMTVNGTVVGSNHIYGTDNKVFYRPVVVFKPGLPVKGKGTKTDPFKIDR